MAGRPSIYTEELAERIANRLIAGESVRRICRDEDMPSESVFYAWMHKDSGFRSIIAPAREAQQDAIADGCLEIADEATPETVHVARLRIWARQWYASKLAPKKYGEKIPPDPPPSNVTNSTYNFALFSSDERATLRALAEKALVQERKLIEG